MTDLVPVGEELMPPRLNSIPFGASQMDTVADSSHEVLPSTPIRKLSRNQGRVVREESIIEDSPETEKKEAPKGNAIRNCRRRLK